MATVDTKSGQYQAERRWIRLQEIGLLQLLAIPVLIAVIASFTGFTVRGAEAAFITNFIVVAVLLLSSGGYACLKIGQEKRDELHKETSKDD